MHQVHIGAGKLTASLPTFHAACCHSCLQDGCNSCSNHDLIGIIFFSGLEAGFTQSSGHASRPVRLVLNSSSGTLQVKVRPQEHVKCLLIDLLQADDVGIVPEQLLQDQTSTIPRLPPPANQTLPAQACFCMKPLLVLYCHCLIPLDQAGTFMAASKHAADCANSEAALSAKQAAQAMITTPDNPSQHETSQVRQAGRTWAGRRRTAHSAHSLWLRIGQQECCRSQS